MSRYAKGAAFENDVKNDLADKGYQVYRVAGSHSPVDVIAVSRGVLIYVQCKTNGVVGVEEWNTFFDHCKAVEALPIVASRPRKTYRKITDYKDGSKKKQPWERVKL